MKKIFSVLLTICLLFNLFSYTAYSVPVNSEISIEEFTDKLVCLQNKYDSAYVGEIVIKDGENTYSFEGNDIDLTDENGESIIADINEDGIDIPFKVLEENSVEKDNNKPESRKAKKANNNDNTNVYNYAEKLGYEVTVDDNTAVLSQPYQNHRLIVKSSAEVDPLDSVAVVEGYNDLHIIQFDDLDSTIAALDYYERLDSIDYVEPDSVMSVSEYGTNAFADASIESYGWHQSWGSDYVGYDSFIDTMGDLSALPEIVVAVVDSGVELTHYMLEGRILRTGFNVSGSGSSNSENDDNGHGTHVAGIVVDNTTDNVMIKGYKCLDNTGYGPLSSVVLCINKAVEDGVNVINLSLSEEGYSQLMEETVLNAIDHGITVVAAAGNESSDAINYNPANINECITVAAMDPLLGNLQQYHLAGFSNYGNIVDVIAPGKTIGSAWLDNTTQTLDGTSMAAPFVSAAAALLLSVDPQMNNLDIQNYFDNNAGTNWVVSNKIPNAVALHMGDANVHSTTRTARPCFSVSNGDYDHGFYLTITCPDEDAIIYYNANGLTATLANSEIYTDPIFIRKSTNINAFAIDEGKIESLQTHASYNVSEATSVQSGDYTIDSDGYILSYNGTINTNGEIVVPQTINGITVRAIDQKAFESVKSSLTRVVLPDTLTILESNAFFSCTALQTVVADNLTYIGSYAFSSCSSLSDIDLSKTKYIGNYAFDNCQSLSNCNLQNVVSIGNYAFNACNISVFSVPKLMGLGINSFSNCQNLTSFSAPLLKTVNNFDFYNCTNLQTVNIPNVTSFGSNAFMYCSSLNSIDFSKIEQIGSYCFYGCNAITSVTNDLITDVPTYAFSNMSNLTSLRLSKAKYIQSYGISNLSKLKTLYLPSVETVRSSAFESDTVLESIELPSLIRFGSGGNYFKNCSELKKVVLTKYEGELPYLTFNFCNNVEYLIIPKVSSLHTNSAPAGNLKLMYAPNLLDMSENWINSITNNSMQLVLFIPRVESISYLSSRSNIKLYLSERFIGFNDTTNASSKNLEIIAPTDSYAAQWAADNNKNFIDSNSMLSLTNSDKADIAYGGFRFSFDWANNFEFKDYIGDITYGFDYQFGDKSQTVEAENYYNNSSTGKTYFNLVLNDLTSFDLNKNISVRKSVTIDGMTFKSPYLNTTYSQVFQNCNNINADVNRDTLINDSDAQYLTDLSLGLVDSSTLSSTSFSSADMNNDGAIDAFDLSEFDRYITKYNYNILPWDNSLSLAS